MAIPSSAQMERRICPRYRFTVDRLCSIVVNGVSNSQGRVHDVSRDGLMLECDIALQPGARVEVAIDWWGTGSLELNASGHAVRTEGRFAAVKILESKFQVKAKAE